MSAPFIELRGLKKHYSTSGSLRLTRRSEVVRAVDGIDFTVDEHQTMGLVGESGCGKTTTAKLILDLEVPSSGSILFRGTSLDALDREAYTRYRREVKAVSQDPSAALSPRRRVHQLVAEPLLATRTMKRGASLDDYVRSLLEKVGLESGLVTSFPHELSGGMLQRVAIAQALATNPTVIVLDEPVSSLDVSIGAQIMNLLKSIQADFGNGYLLIAHDLATVRYLSHNVAAMYLGKIVEKAATKVFFSQARHPYTLALLSSALLTRPEERREKIILRGDLPSPSNPPSGCRFHTRCWLRSELGNPRSCEVEDPPLSSLGGDHYVSCHFAEDAAENRTRRRLLEIANTGSARKVEE